MSNVATADGESYELFKTIFSKLSSGLHHYAEMEHARRERNGGRHAGPLTKLTVMLGVDDLLDDEWKRVVAMAIVTSLLAFCIALFGNLYFDKEGDKANVSKQEEEEELKQYTWTLSNTSSMDGGNQQFLQDLLVNIQPKWLTEHFTEPTEKLAMPLAHYRAQPSEHWIHKHQFHFPYSLNCLLFCAIEPFIPSDAERVEFDVFALTRAAHLLRLANCTREEELKLVKKSLLLFSSDHVLVFVDVVLQCTICLCLDFEGEEQVVANRAKQIFEEITPVLVDESSNIVLVGRGWGGTAAVALAALMPAKTECVVFGAAPSSAQAQLSTSNVTHFCHQGDQLVKSRKFASELFFKLLVRLDSCHDFTFSQRIQCLQRNTALPDHLESALAKEMEDLEPHFAETYLSSTACFWYTKQHGFYKLATGQQVASQPLFAYSKSWFTSCPGVDKYEEMFKE